MSGGRVRHIVLGDVHVSGEPDLSICTTVGSCVAVCLFDVQIGLGGMNHFLLPDSVSRSESSDGGDRRYGVNLMELLINGLLGYGASLAHLQAKVFGGASLTRGLTDAGARNADFIEWFLQLENIPLVGGSLRGSHGRRVQFWPSSGRARQMLCRPLDVVKPPVGLPVPRQHGELELL